MTKVWEVRQLSGSELEKLEREKAVIQKIKKSRTDILELKNTIAKRKDQNSMDGTTAELAEETTGELRRMEITQSEPGEKLE